MSDFFEALLDSYDEHMKNVIELANELYSCHEGRRRDRKRRSRGTYETRRLLPSALGKKISSVPNISYEHAIWSECKERSDGIASLRASKTSRSESEVAGDGTCAALPKI